MRAIVYPSINGGTYCQLVEPLINSVHFRYRKAASILSTAENYLMNIPDSKQVRFHHSRDINIVLGCCSFRRKVDLEEITDSYYYEGLFSRSDWADSKKMASGEFKTSSLFNLNEDVNHRLVSN